MWRRPWARLRLSRLLVAGSDSGVGRHRLMDEILHHQNDISDFGRKRESTYISLRVEVLPPHPPDSMLGFSSGHVKWCRISSTCDVLSRSTSVFNIKHGGCGGGYNKATSCNMQRARWCRISSINSSWIHVCQCALKDGRANGRTDGRTHGRTD